jgi:hypothetical protein
MIASLITHHKFEKEKKNFVIESGNKTDINLDMIYK